jgi:hypothetical protein
MWDISSLQKRSRTAVRRGVFIHVLVLLLASLAPSGTALAASDIRLEHAADGTLLVVGSGWHRDQPLVISLGQQRFNVRADGSGEFELATGLASYRGELAVHHADAPELAFAALPAAEAAQVSPLAVDLARSVAEGLAFLGGGLGLGLVAAGVNRRRRASRYPRE